VVYKQKREVTEGLHIWRFQGFEGELFWDLREKEISLKNTLSMKGSVKLLREQRDLSLQKRSDRECDLFTSYFRWPKGIHHFTKRERQQS
jgi:hypothetical protein